MSEVITLDELKEGLKLSNVREEYQSLHGLEIHSTGAHLCSFAIGPRGGRLLRVETWRISGKLQTWKRNPKRFRIPIKYGLRQSNEITEHNNQWFHWPSDCPALKAMDDDRNLQIALDRKEDDARAELAQASAIGPIHDEPRPMGGYRRTING